MNRHQRATLRSTPRPHPAAQAELVAIRAAAIFQGILEELQSHTVVTEDTLTRIARESFSAGFAAGASNSADALADTVEAAPANEGASLAELVGTLSPRRLEVLRLVARGLTNREIAQVLGISTNTVKAHLAGILEVLDLTNRTEAAVALREYEVEARASQAPMRLVRTNEC